MATVNTARIAALPDDYFVGKKFTRQDLADALHALAAELESPAFAAAAPNTLCLVPGRGGVCTKPKGHGQRHHYGAVETTFAAAQPVNPAACGVRGSDSRVCKRGVGHAGRHVYQTPVVKHRVDRPWVPITTIQVANEDDSRSYPVKIPGVCSVWDDDSHTRKTNGWEILSAERHRETGVINVTVKQGRNGRARTVRLSRLVYRRPKGK